MAVKYPLANGDWSNAANWNGGTKPVAGDNVYSNNFIVNVDENIDVASLYNFSTTGVTAGGYFNFNTAGVIASITGVTPLPTSPVANIITVSHGSGTVSITSNSNISWQNSGISISLINYTGAGDLTLTCPVLSQTLSGNVTNLFTISKSGTGTLTLNANCLLTSLLNNPSSSYFINSTNGNIVINGNINFSYVAGSPVNLATIRQTSGNLTINGNVILPNFYVASIQTINFSGTLLTINGNVLSGVGYGINSTGTIIVNGNIGGSVIDTAIRTTANITVNGNILASNSVAIVSTSAISVTVTGDIYASYTATGIYLTSGSSVVNLTGNMYNVNGVQAIFAPTILVSPSATTQWTLQQLGVANKVFYSEDTTPGNPIAANVRNGLAYGPGLGTTGTMIVPAASDVRMGVTVDNTTGTGELTAADFLAAIQVSTDPSAERLKNVSTVDSIGNIIKNYNT